MSYAAKLVGGGVAIVGLCLLIPEPGVAQCDGDFDRNGQVTIDEIIRAVNTALNGCTECANVSGVWDFTSTVPTVGPCAASATPTFEAKLTINQRDDCTFDGTVVSSQYPLTLVSGSVSNQAVSFNRNVPGSQMYEGMILSDGRTMGGAFTISNLPGCQYTWYATRSVEGTPAAR